MSRAFTVCHTYPDPTPVALQFCPSTSLMQSYTHHYTLRARAIKFLKCKCYSRTVISAHADLIRYIFGIHSDLAARSFPQRFFFHRVILQCFMQINLITLKHIIYERLWWIKNRSLFDHFLNDFLSSSNSVIFYANQSDIFKTFNLWEIMMDWKPLIFDLFFFGNII